MESSAILTKRKIESLAYQYEITDPVERKIFLQNMRGEDVFLSHASEDNEFVEKLLIFLRYAKGGAECYVDWKDSSLPKVPDRDTAIQLANRIRQAKKFIFVATTHSLKSVWCSWEMGYADRDKDINEIAVLAIKPNNGHWKENEYLQQYPWIEYDVKQKLFLVHKPDNTSATLHDWLST